MGKIAAHLRNSRYDRLGNDINARNSLTALRQNVFELQPLEVRILMSFVAQMSAPPSGPSNTDYAVNLYATGGVASKWVVSWGDTTSNTYLASGQPNGVFPTPFAPTHQYTSAGNYAVTGTATLSTNNFITSKTGFALSANFGTNLFQQSGKTNYTPYANSGNATGEAMAIDASGNSTNGDLYVPSLYNGNRFAITRFTPPTSADDLGGVIDLSWGNRGTLVLNQFGSGTETDTPYAITVSSDGSNI